MRATAMLNVFSWAIKMWTTMTLAIECFHRLANRIMFKMKNSKTQIHCLSGCDLLSHSLLVRRISFGRSRRCYLISGLHKDICQPTVSRTHETTTTTAPHMSAVGHDCASEKCVFINLYCVFTVCLRSLNCANGINLLCDKVPSAETGVRRSCLFFFSFLFIACLRTIPNENDKHDQ